MTVTDLMLVLPNESIIALVEQRDTKVKLLFENHPTLIPTQYLDRTVKTLLPMNRGLILVYLDT